MLHANQWQTRIAAGGRRCAPPDRDRRNSLSSSVRLPPLSVLAAPWQPGLHQSWNAGTRGSDRQGACACAVVDRLGRGASRAFGRRTTVDLFPRMARLQRVVPQLSRGPRRSLKRSAFPHSQLGRLSDVARCCHPSRQQALMDGGWMAALHAVCACGGGGTWRMSGSLLFAFGPPPPRDEGRYIPLLPAIFRRASRGIS